MVESRLGAQESLVQFTLPGVNPAYIHLLFSPSLVNALYALRTIAILTRGEFFVLYISVMNFFHVHY